MQLRQPIEFIDKNNGQSIDLGFTNIDFDYKIDLSENETTTTKKKTRKVNPSSTGIITDTDKKESSNALPIRYKDCYQETDNMLRQSLGEIDMASSMLNKDLTDIRNSKTLKNKYNYIKDLIPSQAQLINTKVSVIKEMNNMITKVNDMEYKRVKDFKSIDETSTDKMVMDLYSNIISSPQSFSAAAAPNISTNTLIDPNLGYIGNNTGTVVMSAGNSIVTDTSSSQQDAGFANYMNNLTPEQNMMLMEGNKNIKSVVCYEPITGAMYFDVYDMSTMKPVPNVPRKSPVFLEGIRIDQQNGIARNPNLKETYPLILVEEKDMSPQNRMI